MLTLGLNPLICNPMGLKGIRFMENMPIAVNIALVAGAISLFGVFANHRLNLWRDKRSKFLQAAEAFRAAFLPAITRLEIEPGMYRHILNEEFRNQEKAAIAFRHNLGRHLSPFDKAWQAYDAYAKEKTDVPILAFLGTEVLDMNKAGDRDHIQEVALMRKKECLHLINNLLKFAETV